MSCFVGVYIYRRKPPVINRSSCLISDRRGRADPFDFNSNARCVGKYIEFFDPKAHRVYSVVRQAAGGDLLRQRFDQVDMPGPDDFADRHGDFLIADNIGKPVLDEGLGFGDRQIDIDTDPLGALFFMLVHADSGVDDEIAYENLPHAGAIRLVQGGNDAW